MIRPYQKEDRQAVRTISCDVAFGGDPAEKFFEGRDILADFLTRYFTDYESDVCFVAHVQGEVIGYLLGTQNAVHSRRVLITKILPLALMKGMVKGILFKRKNFRFLFHWFYSIVTGEFSLPDVSREYPALLHINLKQGFRGQNIGSRLIAQYADSLRRRGISGVHLTTESDSAAQFFEKNGFQLLYKRNSTCLKYLTKQNFTYYCYGKKIT